MQPFDAQSFYFSNINQSEWCKLSAQFYASHPFLHDWSIFLLIYGIFLLMLFSHGNIFFWIIDNRKNQMLTLFCYAFQMFILWESMAILFFFVWIESNSFHFIGRLSGNENNGLWLPNIDSNYENLSRGFFSLCRSEIRFNKTKKWITKGKKTRLRRGHSIVNFQMTNYFQIRKINFIKRKTAVKVIKKRWPVSSFSLWPFGSSNKNNLFLFVAFW